MAKFNIDSSKGKVTDIKGNIDTKKKELSDLEKKKQQLIDGRLELDDAHMDEETQRIVAEGLAKAREKITERGKELSSELDSDASMLEEMAQETDDVKADTEAQRKKTEQKKAMLDKVGLGASLDNAINKMTDSSAQLSDLRSSITEASQEVRNLQTQLGNL